MNEPLISIIIPVKDAQNSIEKCISSILSIDYGNYEVIVIDDGSKDKTPEFLKKYSQRIKIITNPSFLGPSKARNIAFQYAKGEYLAFTDADCTVDKDWLKELLRGFIDREVVGVGGSQLSPSDDTEFGKDIQSFLETVGFISGYIKKGLRIKPTNHNPSCNVMYRKWIFSKVNGFLEGLWPGEDVELDYRIKRLGYKLMYNPDALVYHYRPASFKKFSQMMYKYGWAQGCLVRKYGPFRRIHFEPLLLSIIFTIGIYFFIIRFVFFISYFLLLVLGIAIWFFLKSPDFNKMKQLLLFYLTLIFWNLGFVKGLHENIGS